MLEGEIDERRHERNGIGDTEHDTGTRRAMVGRTGYPLFRFHSFIHSHVIKPRTPGRCSGSALASAALAALAHGAVGVATTMCLACFCRKSTQPASHLPMVTPEVLACTTQSPCMLHVLMPCQHGTCTHAHASKLHIYKCTSCACRTRRARAMHTPCTRHVHMHTCHVHMHTPRARHARATCTPCTRYAHTLTTSSHPAASCPARPGLGRVRVRVRVRVISP